MKFIIVVILLFQSSVLFAVQKAKIISPQVDVYSDADFDADVLESVKAGESYFISDKVYGPFFKIKLKSGKIGYIPDTEVSVDGKGRVVPSAEDADGDPFLQEIEDPPETNKNKKSAKKKKDEVDPEDEEEIHGVTFLMVNFHEDTLGSVQIDDLPAIGYKTLGEISWEVFASFKAPKYYSHNLNASVKGFNLWSDFGMSNDIPFSKWVIARYGGGLFGHISVLSVEAPNKTYDLQDVTVGAYLEGAFLTQIKKLKFDLAMKYFFDRQSYGALAFTVFF
jgi:hypothetical protein